MQVTEFGMLMLVKPLQPENAAFPMLVTSLLIITFLILELPANQLNICLQWNVTFVRALQYANAFSPIADTELGMLMLVKPIQR